MRSQSQSFDRSCSTRSQSTIVLPTCPPLLVFTLSPASLNGRESPPPRFYPGQGGLRDARHLPRDRRVVADQGALRERNRRRPRTGADPPRLWGGHAAPVLPILRLVHAGPADLPDP